MLTAKEKIKKNVPFKKNKGFLVTVLVVSIYLTFRVVLEELPIWLKCKSLTIFPQSEKAYEKIMIIVLYSIILFVKH